MLLTFIIFIPLLGAAFLALLPRSNDRLIRDSALATALLDLLLCLPLLFLFDYTAEGFDKALAESHAWIPALGVGYSLDIDGLSLVLVVLTCLLSFVSVLCSFSAITDRVKEYYFLLLMLQTGMLGTFLASDLFLFFVFWELMLVPMYFLIGVWGHEHRIYASIKFFLYTAFGSALMMIAILWVYFAAWNAAGTPSFALDRFYEMSFSVTAQRWLFAAFFLAFAIKMPLFPFHTWLPYAHTEAPTAGSVILAGVLLKTGVYGFLRFALPMFPDGAVFFAPTIMILALIGIVYGALTAMAQSDVKRLVAYSSVSHMGMLLAGILAFNVEGISGGIIQMLNHGLSTGGLFLIVGIIYERRHTREVSEFGGLAAIMPVYAAYFSIIMLSSIGLPGLNGFIGEFLILLGLMGKSILCTAIAATGVIFGACYMLRVYQKMMFGPVRVEANRGLSDLNAREILTLLPLVLFCFWIGLNPRPLQRTIEPSARNIVRIMAEHQTQPSWVDRWSAMVSAEPIAPEPDRSR